MRVQKKGDTCNIQVSPAPLDNEKETNEATNQIYTFGR